jgi:hypothetical protein
MKSVIVYRQGGDFEEENNDITIEKVYLVDNSFEWGDVYKMLGHLRFEMCSDVVMFWDGCCTQV